MIQDIHYCKTNDYLISGTKGKLLLDTAPCGEMLHFQEAICDLGVSPSEISYVLLTHFHADHVGIAQEIANLGPTVVCVDLQLPYLRLWNENVASSNEGIVPIDEAGLRVISIEDSRAFLAELGIEGELVHTPGHTEDSISLVLDFGDMFVGDLTPNRTGYKPNPEERASWDKLNTCKSVKLNGQLNTCKSKKESGVLNTCKSGRIFYGHGPAEEQLNTCKSKNVKGLLNTCKSRRLFFWRKTKKDNQKSSEQELFNLVKQIMKMIDKRYSMDKIVEKTGADRTFVEDVNRMYLTHRNVGVQGILDRIEIKNR